MRITAAILAGGQSRRMGQDKAAVRVGGRTTLDIATAACAEAGLSVLIVGRNRPPDYAGVPARFVPDITESLGPLGGIVTALSALPEGDEAALVLACDMPKLTARAPMWLAQAAIEHAGADGIAAVDEAGEVQPLFSVYHARCLPAAREALRAGRGSPRRFIAERAFVHVRIPSHIAPLPATFNTPAELDELLRH